MVFIFNNDYHDILNGGPRTHARRDKIHNSISCPVPKISIVSRTTPSTMEKSSKEVVRHRDCATVIGKKKKTRVRDKPRRLPRTITDHICRINNCYRKTYDDDGPLPLLPLLRISQRRRPRRRRRRRSLRSAAVLVGRNFLEKCRTVPSWRKFRRTSRRRIVRSRK